jgi:hypothetical protein
MGEKIFLTIVAVVLLGFYWNISLANEDWHRSMSGLMESRKALLLVRDSHDPENLRSEAQADVLNTDKIILKERARKPYWATLTNDEANAVKSANSDLGTKLMFGYEAHNSETNEISYENRDGLH